MDAVVDTIIHPLDPLSLSEIAEAVAILKDEKALAETIRFPIIRLEEPTKADLAGFRTGMPLARATALFEAARAAAAPEPAEAPAAGGEAATTPPKP